MYHGIIEEYPNDPLKDPLGYKISLKQFEEQMAYLKHYCNVISASDAIRGSNLSRRRKNVVITFDDGYQNNYSLAFPILSQYGFPALFALPTEFINKKIPLWNDVVEYLTMKTHIRALNIKGRLFELDSTTGKLEFLKWLTTECNTIQQEKRKIFIADIAGKLEVDLDYNEIVNKTDYTPLSPDDINTMYKSGLAEFASHSVHHYSLVHSNETTIVRELADSKKIIENIISAPCRYFCIPGGHYNSKILTMIIDEDYEMIFSSDTKEFNPAVHHNVIGRYCITRFVTMPLFADIIHGPFHRFFKKAD
jgi:peptidoglycan/xylan/chitin deacetylase (PgdA/CDA1 family)